MKKSVILILILTVIITVIPALEKQNNNRIFEVLKDEYRMASYFLNNPQKKYYKKLNDDDDKWRYLETFWKAHDLDPTTENNEFLDLIKIRIDHCNQYFTHFKPGWTTDRGRIYIRHGEPYEIVKMETGMSSKHPQRKTLQINNKTSRTAILRVPCKNLRR